MEGNKGSVRSVHKLSCYKTRDGKCFNQNRPHSNPHQGATTAGLSAQGLRMLYTNNYNKQINNGGGYTTSTKTNTYTYTHLHTDIHAWLRTNACKHTPENCITPTHTQTYMYVYIYCITPIRLYVCIYKCSHTHPRGCTIATLPKPRARAHTQWCRHPSLSGEEEERHGCCRQRQDSSVAAPERRVANRSHYSWTRITGPVGRASARQGRAAGTRTTHHQGPQLGASSARPHQLLPLSDPHSAILYIISLLSSHIVSRLNPHQLYRPLLHTHAHARTCVHTDQGIEVNVRIAS